MNNKGYCEICSTVRVVDQNVAEQNPEKFYICSECFKKYIEPIIKESEEMSER